MKAINIEWNVTDDDLYDCDENIVLPTVIDIPEYLQDADVEDISNYITEKTGFCHNGFDLVETALIWSSEK